MKNNAKVRTKKLTSLFLALVMLLSTFAGMSFNAYASSGCLIEDFTREIRWGEPIPYTVSECEGLWMNNRYKTYRVEAYSPDGIFDISITPMNKKDRWTERSDFSVDLSASESFQIYISTDSEEYITVRLRIYDTTKTPKGSSIKNLSANQKQINVKWGKRANVSGYQIQYSKNKNFNGKKTIKIKGSKITAKTVKKLQRKKTYYFRVRTYNRVGGRTYYSNWSKVKTVKTK